MQDPVQVNIGPPRYVTKFSGSKRTKTLKSYTIRYIPVDDTLANLLQSAPDVVSEIMNFHGSPGGTKRDMCDGSIFKSHPVFKEDKKAIQIVAYYDEIELCNALGSKTKKHKMGCLFFSIANIHLRYRSQLKCIFVAAIGSYVVSLKASLSCQKRVLVCVLMEIQKCLKFSCTFNWRFQRVNVICKKNMS